MNEGKIANLIQITNQKIDLLNSHLEDKDVNTFYHVVRHNPRPDYITLMIQDLDFLMARSDISDGSVDEPYLEVRELLQDLRKSLQKEEYIADEDKSSTNN